MPKKKLTKAQVKSQLRTAKHAVYRLFFDKFEYGSDSFISISNRKLEEIYLPLMRALDKLK